MPSQSIAQGRPLWSGLLVGVVLAVAVLLASCSKSDSTPAATTPAYAPTVSMGFPDTMTGGATAGTASVSTGGLAHLLSTEGGAQPLAGSQPACNFGGQHDPDPFRNGFHMTRFLVGTVAAWMCFTDWINLQVSLVVFQNPQIVNYAQNNGIVLLCQDVGSNCQSDDPTGLRITDSDTTGQRTVELFWNNDVTTPGMFISWLTASGTTTGRLVVLSAAINGDPPPQGADEQAPTHMRLDFSITGTQRTAQMYMAFNPDGTLSGWNNPWADGFRIDAVKDLSTGDFQVGGRILTKGQWDPLFGYTVPAPQLSMVAIALASGAGAAQLEVSDLGVRLVYSADQSLGDYLFTKDDQYYFPTNGNGNNPDYVHKTISNVTYEGGKALSGTNPISTDAQIEAILGLDTNHEYTTCTGGSTPFTDPSCDTFLNTLFVLGGGFGVDADFGDPPTDGRDTLLAAAVSDAPTSVFPTGSSDWTGVFAPVFVP